MSRMLLCLFLLMFELSGGALEAVAEPLRVYVIPKGSQHLFWKTVHAGAQQAAEDLGVNLHFRGPGEDDNRFGQERLIRRAIDQRYDAIVLAPNHERRYLPLIEQARQRGIVVVVIDSELQGDFHQSFVATDNYRGGYLAGQALRRALNKRGRVLLVRYLKDNASTDNRERGFTDALRGSEVEIVAEGYVGASVGEAARNSLTLLERADPVDGIFAPNESSTEGMLIALRSTQRLGRVKLVGFDYSPALWRSLQRGALQALVLQQPYEIGYRGVETAVAAIRRLPVPRQIRIEAVVVDRSNYQSPKVRAIIERSGAVSGPQAGGGPALSFPR